MHTRAPRGTRVYVFGSAAHWSQSPRDLDLLVVYEEAIVGSAAIYPVMREFFLSLSAVVGLRVHPTVLTVSEAESEDFVRRYQCIDFETWLARFGEQPDNAPQAAPAPGRRLSRSSEMPDRTSRGFQ